MSFVGLAANVNGVRALSFGLFSVGRKSVMLLTLGASMSVVIPAAFYDFVDCFPQNQRGFIWF